MFDQRSVVLAVLLLAAPLAALAGPEPTTKRDEVAGELKALDLTAPLRGSHLTQSWSVATEARCGLWGIGWAIAHPAEAWREVAFLPADAHASACLRSAAAIEHIPEALAPVRWYQ